jgi:hypothetical protein
LLIRGGENIFTKVVTGFGGATGGGEGDGQTAPFRTEVTMSYFLDALSTKLKMV